MGRRLALVIALASVAGCDRNVEPFDPKWPAPPIEVEKPKLPTGLPSDPEAEEPSIPRRGEETANDGGRIVPLRRRAG